MSEITNAAATNAAVLDARAAQAAERTRLLDAMATLEAAGYRVTPPKPQPLVVYTTAASFVDGGGIDSPEKVQLDPEMHHVLVLGQFGMGELGETSHGDEYRYALLDTDNAGHASVLAKATTASQLRGWFSDATGMLDELDEQAALEAADDAMGRGM